MPKNVFKFPGFYPKEIDLSSNQQGPTGTPAGVVGASLKGPAFVPVTVGDFNDYRLKFGNLNPDFPAPYAADRFLESKNSLTFLRVLGAGANSTTTHIDDTRTKGIVVNAGFAVSASQAASNDTRHVGSVQFIGGRHVVTASEAFGMPMFTNNDSYFQSGSSDEVYLVRGMIFAANDSRIMVLDWNESWDYLADDVATTSTGSDRTFKIAISSSAGSSFATSDGQQGLKVLTASLDPSSDNYFAKILNTDPTKFDEEKHVVYADYAVDAEVATIGTGSGNVFIASGSTNTSANSGDSSLPFLNAFGRFDTRYKTPKTAWFISQPFGDKEYDLFYIESLDDGAYANSKYKVSIANIQKSSNPQYDYGTFSLVVRAFDDYDTDPQILEQFNNLTFDPDSENYIARVIGTRKAYYNFDAESDDDKRIIIEGNYPNQSAYIRVVLNPAIEQRDIPETSLPFGFRGVNVLNTNPEIADIDAGNFRRLGISGSDLVDERLDGAILPPIPHRFKVTRGNISTEAGGLIGAPGPLEIVDARYYWGVKFERNSNVLNPNLSQKYNNYIKSITKFSGIDKLDMLVTGSAADNFNDNKFTLARVALGNTDLSDVTGSTTTHMKDAAYIRNGEPDSFEYKVDDSGTQRITFATLLNKGSSAADFNKFTNFAKFSTVMYGGFDGVNILDKNAALLGDRATSTESRTGAIGAAAATYTSPGFGTNQAGSGLENNAVASYRAAADIITNPIDSNVNIVASPGQREPLVTDYYADATKDYSLAVYVMDIPNYDANADRIFDGDSGIFPDPEEVSDAYEGRAIDNAYVASYFPNVIMNDRANQKRVVVPASVPALSAFAYNDKVGFPWFAPAGFNRAALEFVTLTQTRINRAEQERLYDVHINPIIKFPNEGFVIFAQNTSEQAQSALGSVNVIRMLAEVRRQAINIGNRTLFENITPALRDQVANSLRRRLSVVQSRQGIQKFRVISDDSNNTAADVENNQINVRVVLVPTRAFEFVSVDFVITSAGVQFLM